MADPLSSLTKAELLAEARRRDIPGRSTMTKDQLVDALRSEEGEGASTPAEDTVVPRHPVSASERRRALDERLAKLVDESRRCGWTSVEGFPCGLPACTGSDWCALHGGADIEDISVPLAGHLGFDTWPTLLRHLWMASYNPDPLGLDPVIAEMVWHTLNFLYFDYFRVEVDGIEHVPTSGAGMLVSNHGGAALPYDAVMLSLAVANEAPLPRRVRVIATELFNMLPVISHLYRKAGAAFASRQDASRILGDGHLLGVFPEGERGFMKPVWQAYELQRFGRGGFIQLAGEAGAPIIPVAIVGSEEVHPALFVSKTLARVVRLLFPEQRVDGVAVFANAIPLPVRWRIRFLPAMEAPAAGADGLAVLEHTEEVKQRIQGALDDMLASRRSIF